MYLATLDWIIIGAVLVINFAIAIKLSSKSGKSLEDFFLSGRKLPWYVAGVSMVATTFAADTPLAVTEIVAKQGISGNWLWWNFLIGGLLTTFFFANLWRRSGVLTEVELVNIRYSGRPARFLRTFKVIYHGVIMNAIIIGWVNLALVSILQVFFDLPKEDALLYTFGVMAFVAIYTSISGLWGVAINDMIQFGIAMTGCIILAFLVLDAPDIGGIDGLKSKLPNETLNIFPTIGGDTGDGVTTFSLGIGAFLAFIGFQWWASWYPGAEPGGGGYIAQRMMSAKTEKDAVWATLFFQVAHYCIRPWPWIIVGLCAIVLYPELGADEKRLGFVMAIKDYMPVGLKGLLLVGMFAAYMSTISTQLNWGASYVVNDLYKALINRDAADRALVKVSRITTIVLMIFSMVITTQINSISGVWTFIIECGAGLGLVLILRWYWWRINAWSEIVALIAPYIGYALSRTMGWEFPNTFFFTIGFTTIAWLSATFFTSPTDRNVLQKFWDRVQPPGSWALFRQDKESSGMLKYLFLCWVSSIIMVYAMLFGIGKLIFGEWIAVGVYLLIAGIGFVGMQLGMKKCNFS